MLKNILDFAKAVCEGERTMIDEKKVELMKKLQRLAERGVGGEKEGAQKKLQQLMKKYDIEESDLSDDKLEDHEWKYHNDFELRLLKQTIYKVLGKDGLNQMYHYRSGKGKKTIQGVQCTKAQAIQIGIEYEFYCETWKEEHDFFIQHRSEIRFVKGRLKFGNSKQAAPFPSMVVIFRGAGM